MSSRRGITLIKQRLISSDACFIRVTYI